MIERIRKGIAGAALAYATRCATLPGPTALLSAAGTATARTPGTAIDDYAAT